MEKMAKEKLYQIILDLESEQAEIEKQIQNHKDEILQARRYLQSLYEKEDTDMKIFSPRNIESRYKEDIAKGKEQIRAFEKDNQVLYHKLNLLKKRISALREIWNDTSVGFEKEDREYARWILQQSIDLVDQSTNESEILQDNKTDMLHVVQALDNDRKRIASDLHDTIVQDLVHTLHMVELCNRYMEQDEIQAKLELASIEKYLRETIQKARNFISDLRPMIFDDLGFRETLLNAVEDLQKYTSMKIVTNVDEFSDVSDEKCIVLYKIAMELLRNAVFHSGGNKVSLTLKRKDDTIQLQVSDNGKGFSLNDDSGKHFGLELVKERTYLIGATFHIDSTDKGTCVKIILKK